jgi:hypothetical protein
MSSKDIHIGDRVLAVDGKGYRPATVRQVYRPNRQASIVFDHKPDSAVLVSLKDIKPKKPGA